MKPDPRALQHATDLALARTRDPQVQRLIARIPAVAPRVRSNGLHFFSVAASQGHTVYMVLPDSCTCPFFNDNPPVHNGRKVCKHTLTVRALVSLMVRGLQAHIRDAADPEAQRYALAHPWTVLLAAPLGAATCSLYDPGTGFGVAAKLVNGDYTAAADRDLSWLYQWWSWAEATPPPLTMPAGVLPAHAHAQPAAAPVPVPA